MIIAISMATLGGTAPKMSEHVFAAKKRVNDRRVLEGGGKDQGGKCGGNARMALEEVNVARTSQKRRFVKERMS